MRPLVLALLLLFAGPPATGLGSPLASPDAKTLLQSIGFDADARRATRRGEVATVELKGTSDRELAAGVAMMVRAPLAEVVRAFESGAALRAATNVTTFASLDLDQPIDAQLETVRFGSEDEEEVEELLEAEPDDKFNLARSELLRLGVIADRFPGRHPERNPAAREAVGRLYRRFLTERLAAYRQRGLDGVAPYLRDDDGSRAEPGRDLARAAQRDHFVATLAPELVEAFARPPADDAPFRQTFYWIEQEIDDRPLHVLSHRMSHSRADNAVFLERQFFVGHSYDALHVSIICLAVTRPDQPPRTLVVQINRTSVDKLAGFGTSLRHEIGRGRLTDALEADFAAFRKSVEHP